MQKKNLTLEDKQYNKIKTKWTKKVHKVLNYEVKTKGKNGQTYSKQRYRYFYDKWAIKGYCGQGFYLHNREICKQKSRPYCWGYDMHWAYGGALLNYNYPLNNEKTSTPTSLGIYKILFSAPKIKLQYMNFYYNIYMKNAIKYKDKYILYITNIDYEIFRDLYDTDAVIIDKVYYKNIGPLPDKLKDIVKEAYIEKKKPENIPYKKAFESAFYGKLCQGIYKTRDDKLLYLNNENNMTEIKVAMDLTGLDGDVDLKNQIRTIYCIIPTFQTAYIRKQEWLNFKANKDYVVYMNTDSIYAIKPLNLGEDKGLGCYGIECENTPIRFIRYNAYIKFNLDGSIKESKISGMTDDRTLSPALIELLENNKQPISVYGRYKKDGEIVEGLFDLEPSYLLDNY